MIGKLRQVSEVDLAKFRENRRDGARALAGAQLPGDSAGEFDTAAADKAGIYVARQDADELIEYFGRLRTFYAAAARKGNDVPLWIE
jgi:hypothetical protein